MPLWKSRNICGYSEESDNNDKTVHAEGTVLQDCTTRSAAGVFLRAKSSGTTENSVDFCFTAQPHVTHAPRK